MNMTSNGSSTCAAMGSRVTTQLCVSDAASRGGGPGGTARPGGRGRGAPPPARAGLPRPEKGPRGSEPTGRLEAEPLGDGGALGIVGDEVEPLAVANLIEPQLMREAIAH